MTNNGTTSCRSRCGGVNCKPSSRRRRTSRQLPALHPPSESNRQSEDDAARGGSRARQPNDVQLFSEPLAQPVEHLAGSGVFPSLRRGPRASRSCRFRVRLFVQVPRLVLLKPALREYLGSLPPADQCATRLMNATRRSSDTCREISMPRGSALVRVHERKAAGGCPGDSRNLWRIAVGCDEKVVLRVRRERCRAEHRRGSRPCRRKRPVAAS